MEWGGGWLFLVTAVPGTCNSPGRGGAQQKLASIYEKHPYIYVPLTARGPLCSGLWPLLFQVLGWTHSLPHFIQVLHIPPFCMTPPVLILTGSDIFLTFYSRANQTSNLTCWKLSMRYPPHPLQTCSFPSIFYLRKWSLFSWWLRTKTGIFCDHLLPFTIGQ